MNWDEVKIDDIKAPTKYSLATGPFGSSIGSKYFELDGVPVIRGSNLSSETSIRLLEDGFVFISEELAEKFERSAVQKGDLVFTCWGTINQIGLIDERSSYEKYIVSNKQMKLTPDHKKVSSLFLYYYFSLRDVQQTILNNNIGSSIPGFNLGQLREFKIPLPPLPTQRRIASILSAYDDLIENNLRRIKLLEEAAQHIYREWFVRMRFPGWETVRFGEDGLPEGWRKVTVEKIIEYHIGGGWGNDDVNGDYVQPAFVIRGTDIPKLKMGSVENVPLRYHTVSNFKSRKLQENDLVFEVSGGSKGQPVGRALIVTDKILELFGEQDVICASFCKLIRVDSSQISPYYFDAYISEIYENGVLSQYENQSASNIMNFKFTDFINKEFVVVPPNPIRKMFDNLVRPVKTQIGNLAIQINRLKEGRGILLPRLMNQTIEV